MRRKLLLILGSSATAAAVLGLGANAALAATWTVSNGGTNLGATQSGNATMKDVTTSNTLTCTSGTAKVTIANGTGLSGTGIGTIPSITYGGCTGPLSISFSVTQVGTWNLNASSYSGGVTTGTVSNIDAKLSGLLCTAEVTGTASSTYTNSTGTLAVSRDGNLLTVKSASCLGVLNKNDVVAYTGSDKLNNTPYVKITSP